MKFFIVIIAICVAGALALTDEQKTKLQEHKTTCISESGVDPAVVEKVKTGQLPEDDEKLACFAFCMLKRIGVMNADGSINLDVARAKLPSTVTNEKAEEVINACKDLHGDNHCKTGAKVLKCYMEHKTPLLI